MKSIEVITALSMWEGRPSDHPLRREYLATLPPEERSGKARDLDNAAQKMREDREWSACPSALRPLAREWYDLCAASCVPKRMADLMPPAERETDALPDDFRDLSAFQGIRLSADGMILTNHDGTEEPTSWSEMARLGAAARARAAIIA